MEIIKIKLHSSVDLITNSSTVIFTYSEGSLQAVKELVNEMLKVFGKKIFEEDETFDDIFYAAVLPEEYDEDQELPDNWEELEIQYIKGEIPKQDWMKNSEYDEYMERDTTLKLIPKDEKYSELSKKLIQYLYSTSHEASYDG